MGCIVLGVMTEQLSLSLPPLLQGQPEVWNCTLDASMLSRFSVSNSV